MSGFDVVSQWPELFVNVDEEQRRTVRQVFATEYLSGWEPDRAAVADLVSLSLGSISFDVYLSRAADRAAQFRAAS